MKTEFVDSELEVIRFAEKDIIRTSISCDIESGCEYDDCGECGTHV